MGSLRHVPVPSDPVITVGHEQDRSPTDAPRPLGKRSLATTGKRPMRPRRGAAEPMAIAAPRPLASTSWPRRRGGWVAWTSASSIVRPCCSLRRVRRGPAGRTVRGLALRALLLQGAAEHRRRVVAAGSSAPRQRRRVHRVRQPRPAGGGGRGRAGRPRPEAAHRGETIELAPAAQPRPRGRCPADAGSSARRPGPARGGTGLPRRGHALRRRGPAQSLYDRQGLLQPDQRLRGAGRRPPGGRVDRRHGPLAEGHPFAIFPGVCRVHRAWALQSRGQSTRAAEESVRASAELVGVSRVPAAAGFVELGGVRRRVGDLEGAEEAFREAEVLCGRRRRAWPCCAWPRDGWMRPTRSSSARWRRRPGSGWRGQAPAGAVHTAVACGDLWSPAWRPPSSTPSRPSSVGRRCRGRRPGVWSPEPRGRRRQRGVRHPATSARALAGPRRAVRGRDGAAAARSGPARRGRRGRRHRVVPRGRGDFEQLGAELDIQATRDLQRPRRHPPA